MTVHVVGNLGLDTTLDVPRFPHPGETLVALGSNMALGGKGVNQAVAAARAGARVVLHAAVGAAERETVSRLLGGEAGLTLRLTPVEGLMDTSTILVRPDGENMIVSATACARSFDPAGDAAFAAAIEPGDLVLMQGNLPAAATAACLSAARRRGAITVLNPSPLWEDVAPPWPHIDVLVVNAGELHALSGETDPGRGAEILLARGVGALAVTLGPGGATLFDGRHRHDAAAPAVEARDTSGAGDVFCGILVADLAAGRDPGPALARATAAASLSVTRPGALASCPTTGELAALAVPASTRSTR